MPTLEALNRQIAALGETPMEKTYRESFFFTKKEFAYLPKVMNDGEKILALTSGFMNGTTWLAVCTDTRVIFLDRGMIFGLRQQQISLDQIHSIDNTAGLVFGAIRIWDGASYIVISMVLKQSIERFVSATKLAMEARKRAHSPAGASPPSASASVVEQLEKLAALKEKGLLTEVEFQQQKQKLLTQ